MALYPRPADSRFDIGEGITLPDAGIMETGHVNVEAYTSDERFELERELFGKLWLNIGRAEQIPNPGDWFVQDIQCRSVSAIVVRGNPAIALHQQATDVAGFDREKAVERNALGCPIAHHPVGLRDQKPWRVAIGIPRGEIVEDTQCLGRCPPLHRSNAHAHENIGLGPRQRHMKIMIARAPSKQSAKLSRPRTLCNHKKNTWAVNRTGAAHA